jgi:hypothetical protein
VILKGTVVVEVVDIVHVKNFFRMKDIEFLTGLGKVFSKLCVIDKVAEVVEDIEEFHEHPLVTDD